MKPHVKKSSPGRWIIITGSGREFWISSAYPTQAAAMAAAHAATHPDDKEER